MKTTIKIALVTALFCTTSFADGDMGSGGRSCPGSCLVDNQNTTVITKDTTQNNSDLLVIVKNFLFRIFR